MSLISMMEEPMGNIVYQGERWNVKTPGGLSEAKAMFLWVFDDQGRRVEDRKWLDTAVVPAVKDADMSIGNSGQGEILEFGLWG